MNLKEFRTNQGISQKTMASIHKMGIHKYKAFEDTEICTARDRHTILPQQVAVIAGKIIGCVYEHAEGIAEMGDKEHLRFTRDIENLIMKGLTGKVSHEKYL